MRVRKAIESCFNNKPPWDYKILWPCSGDRLELLVLVQDEQDGPWRDEVFNIELTQSGEGDDR